MPTHEAFVHPFRLPRRGEERAHFNFCCAFAQQKAERPRGVVLSLSESLAEFRVRRRERCLIRFLPRPVRGRKHFARSERRIVRCQRTTEAQSAANLSRKSGFATFSTASENDPEGSFSVSFQLLMRTTQRTVAPPTLAVTLAVPALTGLSLPSALTVTTEVSSLDHVAAASVPRRMS